MTNPQVYRTCQYTAIEVSPGLAQAQRQRLLNHAAFRVIEGDACQPKTWQHLNGVSPWHRAPSLRVSLCARCVDSTCLTVYACPCLTCAVYALDDAASLLHPSHVQLPSLIIALT